MNIDVSNSAPEIMLQMYFLFLSAEIICGFTSIFVDMCYVDPFPFGFSFRIKWPPLDILKLVITTLSNEYNKVAFVRVEKNFTGKIFLIYGDIS